MESNRRLHYVSVETGYYAYCESRDEAKRLLRESLADADVCAFAVRASDSIECGWDLDCLVYGPKEDVKLRDVWPMEVTCE